MEINHSVLEEYCSKRTTPVDSILEALEKETAEMGYYSSMLSGAYQGKLLEMLIQITKTKSVLEVGTFVGYSSICMARALPKDGKIVTLEKVSKYLDLAKKYFKIASVEDKIEILEGDGVLLLDKLCEENRRFDFVFIDANKKQYQRYLNKTLELIADDGVILIDNVLWKGKVLEVVAGEVSDPQTRSIEEFNSNLKNIAGINHIILPIRDGITVVTKKRD